MAAMHLNRRFAGAKFARDLLVEKASSNQHQYFLLTGTQRFVPLTHLFKLNSLRPSRTVPVDGLLNSIEEILIAEWFRKELHCSCFHGPYRHLDVPIPCDEDNRYLNIRLNALPL